MKQYKERIKQNFKGYQELHIHSSGSYRDAVNSVEEIFDSAERFGRSAVAITDHGNMVRLFNALKERTKREKKNIKKIFAENGVSNETIKELLSIMGDFDSVKNPTVAMRPYIEKYEDLFVDVAKRSIQFVPGIEAYISNENDEKMHICLYATDWDGTKTLFKLNNRSQLNKSGDFPQLTLSLLEEYVGVGKEGHGHVIGTSACIAGHLSKILLRPQVLEAKIIDLNEKLKDYDMSWLDTLQNLEALLCEYENKLKLCREARNIAKKEAGKNYDLRIDKLNSKIAELNNSYNSCNDNFKKSSILNDIEKAKIKLDEQLKAQATSKAIAETLEAREKEFTDLTVEIKNIKENIKAAKKEIDPIIKIQTKIKTLSEEKNKIGDVYSKAKAIALRYNDIFGQGNYYIELQNHGIPDELYVYPLLKNIAKETGIPLTCANDVHYATKEDKHKRDIIASTRFNTYIDVVAKQIGNDQLYFKSDAEIAELFSDVPEAIENTSRIAERSCVFYKKEMHLPVFDTKSDMTPIEYLDDFARRNIRNRYPDYDEKSPEWKENLEKRLRYELDVIERMGYASYIAIVQDFIFYAKSIDGKEKVGPGRGSAAGSLVCYLTYITDIDPLRYELLFERFLNPDRVSMPDIDTDFAPSIRAKVVEYVDELYKYKGEYDEYLKNTTCNIYTESILGGKSAIRSVSRVTGVPYEISDRIAKLIPAKPDMTLEKAMNEVSELQTLYSSDAIVKKLIDETLLIEGLPDHTSVHAAGIIIADNPISEYAPMFWSEKCNGWVIQCDKVSCEADIGLLKMDFLILKNLDIISTAAKIAKVSLDAEIDIEKINGASDTDVITKIYAKGETNGVFQFESPGMKQTLINFKPTSIDDVILLNAAYRPGPQQYIPEIIEIKNGKKSPQYLVPEMENILSVTYSKPIYQEQIQQIFNRIAGFSLGEADIIRRAMSKKHLDELEKYKDKFFEGLKSRGVKAYDIDNFWKELLEFASYAFNKSHSAAYSILSYQTAYLKNYYPAAYMTSLLCFTPTDKIPLYIRNAKELGVVTNNPDINKSELNFSLSGNEILFGLGNIKSIKSSAQTVIDEREEHGNYLSFKDFISRACIKGINKGVIYSLILAGAMDSLCKNRKVYSELVDEYYDSCKKAIKRIKDKNEDISYASLRQKLNENWISPVIPDSEDFTKDEILEYEKEYLGFYASGHPLDEKEQVLLAFSDVRIADIDENTEKCTICGRLFDKKILRRKSDGREMCKFKIEDLTGEIECICYTRGYEKFKDYLEDGKIVSVNGKLEIETDVDSEGELIIMSRQLVVMEVKPTSTNHIMLVNVSLIDYVDILHPYLCSLPTGETKIILNDSICNETVNTTFQVSVTDKFLEFLNNKGMSYQLS